MEMMLVSQKRSAFDPSGVCFDGFKIPQLPAIKLVGFNVNSRLRWGPMIDRLAKKARARIGALRRIGHHLDSNNMETMYTSFIRSIMEFGSVAWMGAPKSHLETLDRVQDFAKRIGGFCVLPLQQRREATVVAFALKLLDGGCKGVLKEHVPALLCPQRAVTRSSRHTLGGIQIKLTITASSLDTTRRGFHGALPAIWSKLPQSLVIAGHRFGWLKIKARCVSHILKMNSR
jgi:hypothetical protein